MSSKKSKGEIKAEKKQKTKAVEEKTFGMKNKNKSKKVQSHISQMKKTVQGNPRKEGLDPKEEKKLKKLAEKEREKELKELFTVLPTKEELEAKKKKEEEEQAALEAGEGGDKEEEVPEEELLEELGKIEEELLEEEDMSLEEVIEKDRTKITNPIPVTEESFKKWKLFKLQQQEKELDRLRKQEEQQFKKSGGGISGRHLFELDQNVFKDDENAEHEPDTDEKDEAIEVDEDLFLEGDEDQTEEEQPEEEHEDTENYDESKWEDRSMPPKAKLQDWLIKRKIKIMAKYESVPVAIGALAKCILPHLDNKEFLPAKVYNNKKGAENNAALWALRFLESEESNAAEQSS